MQQQPGLIALADGTCLEGVGLGPAGHVCGELVFNTAMSGYQEIMTDPSYAAQIITFTCPHIGNVGMNAEDWEASRLHARGVVLRDLPLPASNWRAKRSFHDFLIEEGIPAIAEVDTRFLTRYLRDHGAQNACILVGDGDKEKAIALARETAFLEGQDLAKVVTTDAPYTWTEVSWQLGSGYSEKAADSLPHHVVVYDFGVKRNILRLLVDQGCRLTVVPATTPAEEVLAMQPDGVFLSNGPGDPAACDYAIKAIQTLVQKEVPMFGICLGHQLLALALGAKTEKMKFGHHGGNHPVQDLESKTVSITSQNHGFVVAEDSLPKDLIPTHRSLFDGTLQGMRHSRLPVFSFQGHPEASPGPHDLIPLFKAFAGSLQTVNAEVTHA